MVVSETCIIHQIRVVAQLVARGIWDAEVEGSSPFYPTNIGWFEVQEGFRKMANQRQCLRWKTVKLQP